MSIKVSNLVKTYGEQIAVNNISFEIGKGEIVGFLGPNGAGKSTSMKVVTSYIPASSGVIEVCGIDVVKNSVGSRKKIGYLPEHNPLYLDLYVKEHLNIGGLFYGMKGKKLSKRINEVIDLVGLNQEKNKKVGALSKGYRQRVGLAMALIHEPEILILDEPTTGLDPNQIIEIREVIKNIGREKTVLFSTHIMQEVTQLCDRVLLINKGELKANDSVDNLLKGKESMEDVFKELTSN